MADIRIINRKSGETLGIVRNDGETEITEAWTALTEEAKKTMEEEEKEDDRTS